MRPTALVEEALKAVFVISPLPLSEGGRRDAAATTDQAHVAGLLIEENPPQTHPNGRFHRLILHEMMSTNRTIQETLRLLSGTRLPLRVPRQTHGLPLFTQKPDLIQLYLFFVLFLSVFVENVIDRFPNLRFRVYYLDQLVCSHS